MNNFRKVQLEEITNNFDKLRIPLSTKERLNLEKKYRYFGAQGVIDYVDNYIFDGEYILVAEDGENLKSQNNNICNFVTGKFWVNNHAHILQAKENNDLKFIYYLLNIINFRPYITGSAQPKLTQDNLNQIELSVPDFITQRKIASVLSALDSKIELNNRINAELEAMAKTLYDYWFVQFDFPDENGKPYKSSGGKMIWNDELKREIPEGWEVKNLIDVSSLLIRGVSPKYIENDGISVLNQKCIRNKSISFSFGRRHDNLSKNAGSKLIQVGDILVNSTGTGTLGRVAFVKWLNESLTTVDSHVSIVRINSEKANQYFTGYSLTEKQTDIEQLGEGSTGQTELSRDNLGKLKLIFPPDNLQQIFENFIKPQFQKIAVNEQQNQQLAELRDWLLPMLMNGRVTVKDKQ